MTSRLRLAIIGSGEIANFHVSAAMKAGFDVVGVAARKNSQTVQVFAQTHGIPQTWSDPNQLIAEEDHWDALIIAASTEAVIPLLAQAIEIGKPVLVEKPVATTSSALIPFLNCDKNVMVGFNRRFYAPVQAAKRFLDSGGPCSIHLQLPESVTFDQDTKSWDTKYVRLNSVHGFDLVNYLTGGLSLISTSFVGKKEDRRGGAVVLGSSRGDICTISANWNAPANFALTIDRESERFELRPLEFGIRYKGLEVVEPTIEVPIRRYLPKNVEQFPPDQQSLDFKPGFVAQCEALAALVHGNRSEIAATIHDAYLALLVAEALLD